MNLHRAWEARDRLNEKMAHLLLRGLENERAAYVRAIAHYPADHMAQYGQPALDKLDQKIATITALMDQKFTT
jgi:hypothetical protein